MSTHKDKHQSIANNAFGGSSADLDQQKAGAADGATLVKDSAVANTSLKEQGLQANISRRGFLAGAAAAALGSATLAATGCAQEDENQVQLVTDPEEIEPEDLEPLMVSEDHLVTLADFTQIEQNLAVQEAEFTLNAGSQLMSAGPDLAVVLATGTTASPLSTVSLFNLQTGVLSNVLSEAVGGLDGFEIYDVAASQQALAWSEINMFTSEWHLYGAELTDATLGQVFELDSGDANWDPPQFVVEGTSVIWNMLPTEDGEYTSGPSYVKMADAKASAIDTLYQSPGRLPCAPEFSDGLLTIAPRVDTSGVYYNFLAFDPNTMEQTDSLVLPRSVRPLNAIYMNGAFTFSIEATYDTDSAITQMGTYRPLDDETWLRVARTPACTPAWCNGNLVVKNGKGSSIINTQDRVYYHIPAPGYSWDYGDYLISNGTCSQVVTYATVDPEQDVNQAAVIVRVFSV